MEIIDRVISALPDTDQLLFKVTISANSHTRSKNVNPFLLIFVDTWGSQTLVFTMPMNKNSVLF